MMISFADVKLQRKKKHYALNELICLDALPRLIYIYNHMYSTFLIKISLKTLFFLFSSSHLSWERLFSHFYGSDKHCLRILIMEYYNITGSFLLLLLWYMFQRDCANEFLRCQYFFFLTTEIIWKKKFLQTTRVVSSKWNCLSKPYAVNWM